MFLLFISISNYKCLIEIYEFKYKNFDKEKIAKFQEEFLDKFDTSNKKKKKNIYIYIYMNADDWHPSVSPMKLVTYLKLLYPSVSPNSHLHSMQIKWDHYIYFLWGDEARYVENFAFTSEIS